MRVPGDEQTSFGADRRCQEGLSRLKPAETLGQLRGSRVHRLTEIGPAE